MRNTPLLKAILFLRNACIAVLVTACIVVPMLNSQGGQAVSAISTDGEVYETEVEMYLGSLVMNNNYLPKNRTQELDGFALNSFDNEKEKEESILPQAKDLVQEVTEKGLEDWESKKAKEAEEAKKAQEAEKAKNAQEAEEAKKAQEAEEAKKAQEAEEAKKAQEAEEAKKAAESILPKAQKLQSQGNWVEPVVIQGLNFYYWDFYRGDAEYLSIFGRVPNGPEYENLDVFCEDEQNKKLFFTNGKFVPYYAKFSLGELTHYCPCYTCCPTAGRYNGGEWLEITHSGHFYQDGDHILAVSRDYFTWLTGIEVEFGQLVYLEIEGIGGVICSIEDSGVNGSHMDVFHPYHYQAVGYEENIVVYFLDYEFSDTVENGVHKPL